MTTTYSNNFHTSVEQYFFIIQVQIGATDCRQTEFLLYFKLFGISSISAFVHEVEIMDVSIEGILLRRNVYRQYRSGCL